MKHLIIRLTCAAALVTGLTGCIMYVSPDHTYHTDNGPAPADEKPAATVSGSQSF